MSNRWYSQNYFYSLQPVNSYHARSYSCYYRQVVPTTLLKSCQLWFIFVPAYFPWTFIPFTSFRMIFGLLHCSCSRQNNANFTITPCFYTTRNFFKFSINLSNQLCFLSPRTFNLFLIIQIPNYLHFLFLGPWRWFWSCYPPSTDIPRSLQTRIRQSPRSVRDIHTRWQTTPI